ncbi:MAG: hypothetical protein MB52_00720 [marine actinobacterium MedAcidi-G1]|mgnify:CR=1|nr:MAG: hypothetical protein MB52_00720 [marine actinobacterium MedAcidi-G1]HAQ03675.1 hypothetical protein [Acidimicrobiaceae bacterium]|tara:strand:- start:14002 stop:14190 length:189 start_codon:yes stop_codon:yes gene_type:complete
MTKVINADSSTKSQNVTKYNEGVNRLTKKLQYLTVFPANFLSRKTIPKKKQRRVKAHKKEKK